MSRTALLAAILFLALFETSAWCTVGKRRAKVFLCERQGKKSCIQIHEANDCVNLTGHGRNGNYVSGYTGGNYSCTVWERFDCRGKNFHVIEGHKGSSMFPLRPWSVKCPCVSKNLNLDGK